eukprot:4961022-Pyramimonas_sp.AAC.1
MVLDFGCVSVFLLAWRYREIGRAKRTTKRNTSRKATFRSSPGGMPWRFLVALARGPAEALAPTWEPRGEGRHEG